MLSQHSPNHWSCLPTSFAMCLGVPLQYLLWRIGHDGSEVLWPELPPPKCYRGFHPQEMIDCCLHLEVTVTCVEALPTLAPAFELDDKLIFPHEVASLRVHNYIHNNKLCVIAGEVHGNSHAVACINQVIQCPSLGQLPLSHLDDWAIREVYLLR